MNEEKNTNGRVLTSTSSKNKRVLALILIVTIIVIAGAVSYAFLPTDNLANEPMDALASTATLKLKYTDCASTNIEDCANISADLYPGDSITKTFEVENTGTKDIKFDIFFRELENTFKNGDLIYTLESVTTREVIVSSKPVPEGSTTNVLIKRGQVVPVGSVLQYKLTVTFLNRDYEQSDNYDATFSLKLKIDDAKMVPDGTMMARVDNEKLWAHKGDIKNIVFENTKKSKPDATYIYDLSDNTSTSGSVMAYLVPDANDSTKYTAYIQGNGGVKAPAYSGNLFLSFSNLESIEGLEYFDTSITTDMSRMFQGCQKLLTLDLSNFDTSKVVTMGNMFNGCLSLTTLDLSTFDTSKVDFMGWMFMDCSSLTNLDLSNFDTSKVNHMGLMFLGCCSLTKLDVSSFDTSKVTNMYNMFDGCSSLTNLNVSGFDTSKVTSMKTMFSGCSSLTNLDVNNFDTSKVTNMNSMFAGCSSLTTLDLSNFDTSKVTDMINMFLKCKALTTTITIRGTLCTKYSGIFYNSAINNNVQITVNYTADASDLVDQMIATKSSNSNVVKGSIVA